MSKRKKNEQTTDQKYWSEYTNLQHIKHQILRKYLDAWFPILTRFNGHVSYIDTHAGRGKYKHGQPGSPIVALKSLVNHAHREAILKNSSVSFFFIERYPDSIQELQAEADKLGKLPPGITCSFVENDHQRVFESLCERLDKNPNSYLVPSFIFYDPYSFLMPLDLLARILSESKCEVFMNFMWRYLNLAIHNPQLGQHEKLDNMFGDDSWRSLLTVPSAERCDAALDLVRQKLNAKYMWAVRMYGDHNELKYALVHFANHEMGFQKMKDAVWSAAPDGIFEFWQKDDPNQETLVVAEPSLTPIENMLRDHFGKEPFRLHDGYKVIDPTIYRRTHYHQVVKKLIKNSKAKHLDEERFVIKNNPQIQLD